MASADLSDHHAVCVSVNSPIYQLWNAWTTVLQTWYVNATGACLNGVLYKSLSFYAYASLKLLANGSVKTLPLQQIHKQQLHNCWTYRFLCDPCRMQGKQAISSSHNFR
jgi:hypothetical protein